MPFPPPAPLPPPLMMPPVPEEVVSVELANLGLMTPEEEQSNQQLHFTVRRPRSLPVVPGTTGSGAVPKRGQLARSWSLDAPMPWLHPLQCITCLVLRDDELQSWRNLTCALGGMCVQWTPGSKGAHVVLDDFVRRRLPAFDADRAKTDRASTSRLSPHVHYGEISVRFIFHVARPRQRHASTELPAAVLQSMPR